MWREPYAELLFTRLARPRQGGQRWLPLAPAAGLGAASLAVAARALADAHPLAMNPLSAVLLAVSWGVVTLIPPYAAGLAAALSVQFIRSDAHQLLRLTNLPGHAHVQFHVMAALHRLRPLAALVVALTPCLLVGTAHWTYTRASRLYPGYPFRLHLHPLPPPYDHRLLWRVEMIGWTPEFFGWAVGMWGAVALAVAVGVGLALRLRQPVSAALAPLPVLLINASLLASTVLLPLERAGDTQRALAVLTLAIAPYALGLTALHLARRWG